MIEDPGNTQVHFDALERVFQGQHAKQNAFSPHFLKQPEGVGMARLLRSNVLPLKCSEKLAVFHHTSQDSNFHFIMAVRPCNETRIRSHCGCLSRKGFPSAYWDRPFLEWSNVLSEIFPHLAFGWGCYAVW